MIRFAFVVAVLVVAAACSKPTASPAPPGQAAAADGAEASAVAPEAGGSPEAGAGAVLSWSGTYKSEAGSLYVPDGWKVRWRAEDEKSGIGEGPITLSVDPAGGRAHGTLGGPLGPAKLEGQLAGGVLTASIERSDPHDQGFVGVLRGETHGGHVEGTLNASPSTAGAVRVGTFVLSPAAAAAEH